MKNILLSLLVVVLFIGSANIFAMDKLTQAEKAKVITAAKAAKGDEQKFQAAIKSIPKAVGITLADALPGAASKTTGGKPEELKAQMDFTALKDEAEEAEGANLKAVHDKILTFWEKPEVQKNKDLEAKVNALEGLVSHRMLKVAIVPSVFTPATTTTSGQVAPASPRTQAEGKIRAIHDKILEYAQTLKNEAEYNEFVQRIDESIVSIGKTLGFKK